MCVQRYLDELGRVSKQVNEEECRYFVSDESNGQSLETPQVNELIMLSPILFSDEFNDTQVSIAGVLALSLP